MSIFYYQKHSYLFASVLIRFGAIPATHRSSALQIFTQIISGDDSYDTIVMRERCDFQSAKLPSTLKKGDVVAQVPGSHIMLIDNACITRVHVEDGGGRTGWVTWDARPADGPLFLEEVMLTLTLK